MAGATTWPLGALALALILASVPTTASLLLDPVFVSDAVFTPALTVAVRDWAGNVCTTESTRTITATLSTGVGTLSGGGAVTVVEGIGTFTAMSVDLVGVNKVLTFASPTLQNATMTFGIRHGPPFSLFVRPRVPPAE
jgi:hypothetical protein